MGSLSIWHWLIPFIFLFAIYSIYRSQRRDRVDTNSTRSMVSDTTNETPTKVSRQNKKDTS
jgi:Ca2+/Na+ antiporter